MIKTIKIFLSTCAVCVISLSASIQEQQSKERMIAELQTLRNVYDAGYAPGVWKKALYGYDLDNEFEKAKNDVLETHSLLTKDFQKIIKKFVSQMRDYHVNVLFHSTEKAYLPFTVKGAQGKYFINWIDAEALPRSGRSFEVGDEIVQWGNEPIQEVIDALITDMGEGSNRETDIGLACMILTTRLGASGSDVPQGTFPITVRSAATSNVVKTEITWQYFEEGVFNPLNAIEVTVRSFPQKNKFHDRFNNLFSDLHLEYAKVEKESILGSRKSFLPPLGPIVWSNETNSEEERSPFYAYIYSLPNPIDSNEKMNVGYVRIPHYLFLESDTEKLGQILETMINQTDALVIDQLHNGGGFANFLHDVLSMLTSSPLTIPRHRFKITQRDAQEAYVLLQEIKALEGNQGKEDYLKELLKYQEKSTIILNEWNQGITLTSPLAVFGEDTLQPHSKRQYTKPLIVLVDEMDFSCADFFPAILQDNQRALIFGKKTAGAGGFVMNMAFPNRYGIDSFSYTMSIAERPTGEKIEDLGVNPDVSYEITPEDIQNGYKGYIEALNRTVFDIICGQSSRHRQSR